MVKSKIFPMKGLVTLLFIWMVVTLLSGNAFCANFSAKISRNQISINDSVILTLTLSGRSNTEPDLAPLNKDFEIGARSHSSQINIINSHINHSTVWKIGLLPKRAGTLTIPSLCCDNVCSMPLTVVVADQSHSANNTPVLLETEVSSVEVIAQSQLIYTIRLLMSQPLSDAALSQIQPQGVETNVKIVPDDLSYNITRNGQTYQVIERNYILFPQHAGTLKLPPIRLEGTVPINNGNNRSPFNDPFDLLGQQGQRIRLHSKAISVKVIDPVDHKPNEPWLPAQQLSISDDWQQQPPTLTVGEAATRTITTHVSALSANTLPELKITAPDSFKTYPDKTLRNDHISRDGIRGELVQKIALVPTRAGTFTLPEISMRWWDKNDRHWKRATVKAMTVKVLPNKQTMAETPQISPNPPKTTPLIPTAPAAKTSIPDQASPAKGQHNSGAIKGESHIGPTPLQNNPWLWISLICVIGWISTIIFYRRRQQKLSAETPQSSAPANQATTEKSHHTVTKQQVIQLAKTNQAAETRKALLAWIESVMDNKISSAQMPAQTYSNNKRDIDSFLQLVDEPLRREINYLERYLFADDSTEKKESSWDGTALAEQLQLFDIKQLKVENSDTKKGDNLPSFYP